VHQRDRIPLVAALAFTLVAMSPVRARAAAQSPPTSGHAHAPMSEAAMKARAERWWASHKPVGTPSRNAAVVTVSTLDFQFDADGNLATAIDTVKVLIGDTVTWQWVNGFHTVTNGVNNGDPQAGTIFDAPVDQQQQSFSFQFNDVGIIPYFCVVHEGTMTGFVQVRSLVDVEPVTVDRLGFTRDPSPNPTAGEATFAFAVRQAGAARAEVFDAQGRRVAVPLDLRLGPGTHAGAWNARDTDGRPVRTGVYYLRLTLPGYVATRVITVAR
jgi:plastocyanin